MSQHTPGPWLVRKTGGAGWPEQRGFAIDFNEAQEQVVDFVYEEADAYLIAAAPELLAALELCAGLAAHRMTDDEWRQVQATIAKARGES